MALSRLSPTDVLPSSFLHPSIVQTHYCDGSRNTLFSRNHEECSSLCESTGSIFVSLECQHHVSEPFFAPSVKHLSHLVLSSGHVSSERLPLSIVFWRVDTDNNALVSCTRAYIHHVYQARRQKRQGSGPAPLPSVENSPSVTLPNTPNNQKLMTLIRVLVVKSLVKSKGVLKLYFTITCAYKSSSYYARQK